MGGIVRLQNKAGFIRDLRYRSVRSVVPNHGRKRVFPGAQMGSEIDGFIAPVKQIAARGAERDGRAVGEKPIAIIAADVYEERRRLFRDLERTPKVIHAVAVRRRSGHGDPARGPGFMQQIGVRGPQQSGREKNGKRSGNHRPMYNVRILRANGISKSFAGVRALRGVSFDAAPGEVHALAGENGAGKSTLIKVLTGAVQPDSGTIEIDGATVEHNSPARARALGIAAIYQQPALFPDLSVAENIALGTERPGALRRVDWRGRRERARELLDAIGASIDARAEAGSLSMPEQQLVEIARALGANAKYLILDEPTASLMSREVAKLFDVIGRLRERRTGLVYISHRLEELSQIADRVTVLRDGAVVDTRPMAEADRATLIRAMAGREIAHVFPKIETEKGEIIFEVRGLSSVADGIRDVSFQVRAGEILS